MTVEGCCLLVHHDRTPTSHLPSTIHPWHSASYPPPSPVTWLCCFLNANKPTLGKKGLKRALLWSTIKQMFDAEAEKKKYSLFLSKSNIYIFEGRRHSQGSTCRQTDNCRMRGQETGDGNVLDCGCAELCSVVLRDKLM